MLTGYNFTERVRKTLALARESAATFHHSYVSTEHILLGLLREGEGVAAAVLQNLGTDLSELAARVEGRLQHGSSSPATGPDLPYTSAAKRVLELAMGEARDLSHSYVGTEHVLIGLMREENGIAAQVLAEEQLGVDGVRTETLRLLGTEIRTDEDSPKGMRPSVSHSSRGIAEITIHIRHHDGSTVRGEFRSASLAMLFLRRNALAWPE